MPASRWRARTKRRRLIESLEPRLVLTADSGGLSAAAADLVVDQINWQGLSVDAYQDRWVVCFDAVEAGRTLDSLVAETAPAGWSATSLGDGFYSLATPGAGVDRVSFWAGDAPGIVFVEPDFVLAPTRAANDPSFSQLWGLSNTGQSGGLADADIDAPEAWSITTGSRSVVIAVIDTGVDVSHPDLAANIWRNPGEIPGNGIDDDRNGFVDDVSGWDFVSNDNIPQDGDGHGTHVAGTIGAVGNNGRGVVGVNWEVSILPLKFLTDTGTGSTSAAIAAINYATALRNAGINVVASNNSWGGGGYSTSLRTAISRHNDAGIMFVVAAGNDGINNDVIPSYPANYDLPNVISVAATDRSDRLASFSNYGRRTVDLGAPGVSIHSTSRGGGYATMSGTSMAAPHVTGVVGLLAAVKPQATVAEIRAAILGTVVPVAALGSGKTVTGGRLNAAAAVERLAPGGGSGGAAENPGTGEGGTDSPGGMAPAPLEPNDTIGTATDALPGGMRESGFAAAVGDGGNGTRDVDLFAVTLAAGETLDVTVFAMSVDPGLNSYLRLFNAAGTELAANDDAGDGSLNSRVSYVATQAGVYYVGLSGAGNSVYSPVTGTGTVGGSTGDYVVTFQRTAPPLPPEPPPAPAPEPEPPGEPNDTLATATVGLAADSPAADLTGVIGDGIHAAADVDIFSVVLGAGDMFEATVRGQAIGSSLDSYLRLFDADGVQLAANDDYGGSLDSSLVFTPPAAGTYFLGVSGYGNARYAPVKGDGTVAGSVGEFELALRRTVPGPAGRLEPNDTLAQATAVTLVDGAAVFEGLIGDGGQGRRDVDLFAVALAAGETLTVAVSAWDRGSALDSYLRLFDAAGRQLAANDDFGGFLDSRLRVTVTASGTYFIGLSGYRNAGYDPLTPGSGPPGSTGSYSLVVTVGGGEPPPPEPGDALVTIAARLPRLSLFSTVAASAAGPARSSADLFRLIALLAASQQSSADL